MGHLNTRLRQPRWRTLSGVALATVVVAIIGFTTVAPAKADYDDWRWRRNWHERQWREREWREHHRHAYGYYSYPSYGYNYNYNYNYYR